MKNVLVTGGAGFIGSNFIHHLLGSQAAGPSQRNRALRVLVLDVFTYAGHRESLEGLERPLADGSLEIVAQDICTKGAALKIMMERGIDTVVHFAAETHVDRSIHGPEAFLRTNVMGTFELLEAARTAWAGSDPARVRFHHVSTDEVYGSLGPGDPAFRESTPYDPSSPYSASKAGADHLVRAYHRTYGLPITISNCSNNYGPFQHPEKLIPLMILNALMGKSLPVYGDGRQRRDWIYVLDHCEAILRILEAGTVGETYNVGSGSDVENLRIVEAICDELDVRMPSPGLPRRERLITHVQDRPGHDRRYAIDTSKISRELGWTAAHSFTDGLKKTIDWYLSSATWLKAVMQKNGEFEAWLQKNYAEREGPSGEGVFQGKTPGIEGKLGPE